MTAPPSKHPIRSFLAPRECTCRRVQSAASRQGRGSNASSGGHRHGHCPWHPHRHRASTRSDPSWHRGSAPAGECKAQPADRRWGAVSNTSSDSHRQGHCHWHRHRASTRCDPSWHRGSAPAGECLPCTARMTQAIWTPCPSLPGNRPGKSMVDEPRRESCKAQPAHGEGARMPPQPATAMATATGTGTGSGLCSAGLPGRLARAMQADGAPGDSRPHLWPYHPEGARSRLVSEAKQGRAWSVLGWETAWEYRVP